MIPPNTFNYPRLMCFDPVNGDLIVANTDSNEIVAWSTTGHEQWAGTGLADPYGVACGVNGTVYAANSNGKNVVVFNSSGAQTGTIGSNLGFVRGIWVDTDGSIWVDVAATGDVYHFSAAGTQLAQFNVGRPNGAFGIAGDAGYLYIALSSKNTSRQYTRSGTLVSTFGGAGTTLGQDAHAAGPDVRTQRQPLRRRGEHRPGQRVDRSLIGAIHRISFMAAADAPRRSFVTHATICGFGRTPDH